MNPSWPQAPPQKAPSASSVTISPSISILLSLPSMTNAMDWLSGDQKGAAAPSVCARGRAVVDATSDRTQRDGRPSTEATNARRRPSGESAMTLVSALSTALSGAVIVKTYGSPGVDFVGVS